MQDEPRPDELVKAVADFLRDTIVPEVSGGHSAFKLRVAINALNLVVRQLTLADSTDAAEQHRLSQMLGVQGALKELNALLAARIALGEMNLTSPGLADHLWATTLEKLAVDQPRYETYRRELERKG